MLAVQNRWKPFSVDDHEDYYHCITVSDEALALFIIKYYTALPYGWNHQKNATMEDDLETGPPEGIEAVVNQDQATDSRKRKRKRKDRLSVQN